MFLARRGARTACERESVGWRTRETALGGQIRAQGVQSECVALRAHDYYTLSASSRGSGNHGRKMAEA